MYDFKCEICGRLTNNLEGIMKNLIGNLFVLTVVIVILGIATPALVLAVGSSAAVIGILAILVLLVSAIFGGK